MRLLRRNTYRNISILVVISLFVYTLHLHYNNNVNSVHSNLEERHDFDDRPSIKYFDLNEFFPETKAVFGLPKVDWHNKTAIEIDNLRTGPGEQGRPASHVSYHEEEMQKLWDTNGFDALLSDSIALDRSLTDIRHEKCKEKKYNKILPTVSVVIPYFEEHWTTLLRTVVSVINRSPPSILKEIILVDDGSHMKAFLGEPLDVWMKEHYKKVRVIHLPDRKGLIEARQTGAREAKGEVIVVLDSHCEVMIGWLPPLLEPIVENPRVVVCPLIDVINHETFAYTIQDNGARGAFDWRFYYKRLPLFQKDLDNMPEPFENPVMNGGLFAMSLKFFWELGGYDLGLKIWGGEQYNLSFKIWLCGGRLLDAPCSRVGHIFRHGGKNRPAAKDAGDFINVNYKRVAAAWMDEYINALYRRNPHLRDVKEGDISAELAIKKKLQCKPFEWFLTDVAPDLVQNYPPVEPPDFANGTIRSDAHPQYCIDTASRQSGSLIMYVCHGQSPQFFSLSYIKMIKVETEQFCWASPASLGHAPELSHCQKNPPTNHIWRYDPEDKTIIDKQHQRCLQANVKKQELSMEKCSKKLISQKWTFTFVNYQLIEKMFAPFNLPAVNLNGRSY